ncbi:MAG: MotA/TolQ/ExbB proton channel family protein [Parcubacteria group bacterium]|nr:MotA/TolQ/ExbB proton channel family protein [Parcubacteria group bacterium]
MQQFLGARDRGSGTNTNYVMFMRMLALNSLFAAIVFWAYHEGWIGAVVAADTVYISRGIASLGLLGLIMISARIFNVSRELNIAREYHWRARQKTETAKEAANAWLQSTNSRVAEFANEYRRAKAEDKTVLLEQFRIAMTSKLHIFSAIAEWLVVLGLIGTVVGIRIGTGAIDPSAFRDINLVVPLLKEVIGAFYIAFDTTIVGACSALWLDANLKWILRPGMAQFVNEAVKIGVSRNA